MSKRLVCDGGRWVLVLSLLGLTSCSQAKFDASNKRQGAEISSQDQAAGSPQQDPSSGDLNQGQKVDGGHVLIAGPPRSGKDVGDKPFCQPPEDSTPILITSAAQLLAVDSLHVKPKGIRVGAYYKLANDIDFSGVPYSELHLTCDIFDGAGFTVSHLSIAQTFDPGKPEVSYVGLFSTAVLSTIKNLTLRNPKVIGNAYYTGALVGVLSASTLQNVTIAQPNVSGLAFVGAVVGEVIGFNGSLESDVMMSSTLQNVTVDGGSVSDSGIDNVSSQIGGVAGILSGLMVHVNQVTSSAVVIAPSSSIRNQSAGGLFGGLYADAFTISDSSSSGRVSGRACIGGIVGTIFPLGDRTFTGVKSTSELTPSSLTWWGIGGLIGCQHSSKLSIERASFAGKVTSLDSVAVNQTRVGYAIGMSALLPKEVAPLLTDVSGPPDIAKPIGLVLQTDD